MSSKLYCSPERQAEKQSTCLTHKELQAIAKDYNETYGTTGKSINIKLRKTKLYNAIRERLSEYCHGAEEYCWIEQTFLSNTTKRSLEPNFRPRKPKAWYKNRRTWLNTFDILHVMKQYEKLHKDFAFLGVYPIDFQSRYVSGACIGGSLCAFNVADLMKRGKTRFAMVLNLDDHAQSGSHWVSVFCNMDKTRKNFGVYYYDSVAHPPPPEVQQFSAQVVKQVNEYYASTQTGFAAQFNTTQKQFKNTECGVFSMVFITEMLQDRDFATICKKMKQDDDMNEIRDVLYRPNLT